ncbi:MAG: hypothetical protein WDO73_16185 [Ignavibacteriota bacterium]
MGSAGANHRGAGQERPFRRPVSRGTAQLEVKIKAIKSQIDGEEAAVAEKVAEQKLKAEEATLDLHRAADSRRWHR